MTEAEVLAVIVGQRIVRVENARWRDDYGELRGDLVLGNGWRLVVEDETVRPCPPTDLADGQ